MKICVEKFRMSDVEDPELYAAEPIYNWQQTEKGKWVMSHSIDQPTFYCNPNPEFLGFDVTIFANLSDKDATYFRLKWS